MNFDLLAGVEVDVGLGEARRIGGRTGFQAVRVDAVDTRKRAVLVIERVVLIENNENIFDVCLQQLYHLAL